MVLAKPSNIRFVTNEEMDRAFDRLAQSHFGLSGNEFLDRWERGDYNDPATPEYWRANSIAVMRPVDR